MSAAGALALGTAAALGVVALCAAAALRARRRACCAQPGALAAARLASLERHVNDIELIFGPDGVIVEANDRALAAYGRSRESLRGAPVASVRAPEALAHLEEDLAAIAREGGRVYETRHRRADGSGFPVEVSARIFESCGRTFYHALIRDLSERRAAESRLILTERLASLGTLAAGVVHELNSPLSYVLSNSRFVAETLADDRPSPEELAEAASAARDAVGGVQRVLTIVQGLRRFASPASATPVPVDVKAELEAAIAMTRHEIEAQAALAVEVEPDLPRVLAAQHRLGQVFVNLLVNAAQALAPGPDRRDAEGLRNRVIVRARRHAGHVVVEVADNGPGIPPEIRPRIFDPFFSTKPAGKGTGLGLAICHGIVRDAGGRIEVESAPGAGATFRVLLPAARPGR